MARETEVQRFERLLEKYSPKIREAFLAAIQDLRDRARVGAIAEALERGDVTRALELVSVDPAAFRILETAVREAFEAGGSATINAFPAVRDFEGVRMVLRFDGRSPAAEQWLSNHSSTLVTRIVEDQREAVRQALLTGMTDGRNPRNVALDIVGRIDRVTGRREGGILGLTSAQEQFVANARAELRAGDPDSLKAFLERARRDKRFDKTVQAAIREGKTLDPATVDRMLARYSDNLLQLRGETIARTEAIASLNQSKVEAYEQAIDRGAMRRQDVRRVWQSTKDSRVRDSHRALDGESVGLDQPFSNGLMFPGDPAGDPAETINCRCNLLMRIDFFANVS